MNSALAFFAALAATGCSASMLGLPTVAAVPYEPRVAPMDGALAHVFDAAREFVVAEGLIITYEDANLGRIEAVSAIDSSGGMTTRERLILQVEPGALSCEAQLEKRGRGGIWHPPNRVSGRYTYARERMALEDIEGRLAVVTVRAMRPADALGDQSAASSAATSR